MAPKPTKPITLDGRTGEGGGQLVRIAVALSAVTSTPILITNVRGNRPGQRGGGLKAQHVAAISYLATATHAATTGLAVGSHTLSFQPTLGPASLHERKIRIEAGSAAASALLVFQCVFPFLLFAGNAVRDEGGEEGMIELDIVGGTNVSFSLSFEYLDQVLLPALEREFGVRVERALKWGKRGWSAGTADGSGTIAFKFQPVKVGETLKPKREFVIGAVERVGPEDVTGIDVTIIAPGDMHTPLTRALAADLEALFPGAEVQFVTSEESGHVTRTYVLLVARPGTGENERKWGRDLLHTERRRGKNAETLSKLVSRRVCKELYEEVSLGGEVDEFLQDQMVVFQALAEGRSGFTRGEREGDDEEMLQPKMDELEIEEKLRKDKMVAPFGEGSLHTTTARWVTAELLPRVRWYNKGRVCDGAGVAMKVPED